VIRIRIDKDRSRPASAQFRLLLIWFLCMAGSILWYLRTEEELALQAILFLLMILGAIMTVDTLRDAWYARQSRYWPRATFSIAKAQVERSMGDNQSGPHFSVYLELEYEAHGKTHRTWSHELNRESVPTKEAGDEYVGQVRAGKFGTRLRYNPENPDQAYVKPGIKPRHFLAVIVGLGITIVAYLTLIGEIVWK
jgi:hypothetical protein